MASVEFVMQSVMVVMLLMACSVWASDDSADAEEDVYEVPLGNGTFAFSIDLFASETGYFVAEGYDGHSPTLKMKLGQTYTFYQYDPLNHYHPLGFAYYPDGAHVGKDELEAAVGNGDAPVYLINNEVVELDTYEDTFFYPFSYWAGQQFKVNLTITDPNVREIFYFCHIHKGMSGRIIIEGGNTTAPYEPLELTDYYYVPDAFDATCGTYETSDYSTCADEYICVGEDVEMTDTKTQYVQCMAALDCKMDQEMDSVFEGDLVATFMHQMIPHHQNAVNMAKTLLKLGSIYATNEVEDMLREIVNSQNAQITFMRSWLETYDTTEWEMCDSAATAGSGSGGNGGDSGGLENWAVALIISGAAFLAILSMFAGYHFYSTSKSDRENLAKYMTNEKGAQVTGVESGTAPQI